MGATKQPGSLNRLAVQTKSGVFENPNTGVKILNGVLDIVEPSLGRCDASPAGAVRADLPGRTIFVFSVVTDAVGAKLGAVKWDSHDVVTPVSTVSSVTIIGRDAGQFRRPQAASDISAAGAAC